MTGPRIEEKIEYLLESKTIETYSDKVMLPEISKRRKYQIIRGEAEVIKKGYDKNMKYHEIGSLVREYREDHIKEYRNGSVFGFEEVPFYYARLGLIPEEEAKEWYRVEWRKIYRDIWTKRRDRGYNEFRRNRIKVINRDRNRCVCCASKKNLRIHHIFSMAKHRKNDKNNLITLCERCHHWIHNTTYYGTKSRISPSKVLNKYFDALGKMGYVVDVEIESDRELGNQIKASILSPQGESIKEQYWISWLSQK